MKQSNLFSKTKKQVSQDGESLSYIYLSKADFIEQSISGVYRYLPLGLKVLKNIENIVRDEIEKIGGQEILLPALQKKSLWIESGRWETFDPPLFKFNDRHNKELALAPTHEEEISDVARSRISSYKDLPFSIFQIQNKFRNEMRATGGLLRGREFLMKDLYSFHKDENDLKEFYEKVKEAYFKIFQRCGFDTYCVQADSGSIGGDMSHEFMAVSEVGEDKIFICPSCNFGSNVEKSGEIKICPNCSAKLEVKKAIELGHIFNLGDKYSKSMNISFTDEKGEKQFVIMGCFGIGVSRIMASIVELRTDKKEMIWPVEISPFKIHLISLFGKDDKKNREVEKVSEKIYSDLLKEGIEVLYDDRAGLSAGEKFSESDLIGIPFRIIISEKTLDKKSVELKEREANKTRLIKNGKKLVSEIQKLV